MPCTQAVVSVYEERGMISKVPWKFVFAPSPTGPFPIGGARSALFNWLVAHQEKGTFVFLLKPFGSFCK